MSSCSQKSTETGQCHCSVSLTIYSITQNKYTYTYNQHQHNFEICFGNLKGFNLDCVHIFVVALVLQHWLGF